MPRLLCSRTRLSTVSIRPSVVSFRSVWFLSGHPSGGSIGKASSRRLPGRARQGPAGLLYEYPGCITQVIGAKELGSWFRKPGSPRSSITGMTGFSLVSLAWFISLCSWLPQKITVSLDKSILNVAGSKQGPGNQTCSAKERNCAVLGSNPCMPKQLLHHLLVCKKKQQVCSNGPSSSNTTRLRCSFFAFVFIRSTGDCRSNMKQHVSS